MSFGIYIDTSCHLVLGLFNLSDLLNDNIGDNDFWIDYVYRPNNKSATIIHDHLYQMLTKNHLDIGKVETVFQAAGPGSYTGMRISHGIAEVLTLFDKKKYAFYHFEVPKYLGIEGGVWISRAFKGEYFVCEWRVDGSSSCHLLDHNNLLAFFFDKIEMESNSLNVYTHFISDLRPEEIFDLNTKVSSLLHRINFLETSNLVFTNPRALLRSVFLNSASTAKKPYYYRPLEKEFKIS